ncbi:SDR family NAD(P)-dependent oxidoreductase [Modestobacter roseus]|uniref:2-hydroxycyclohexanecarboxyl-CoA dehydrogenase n=1 Tax=Modestobacter roseus TaxID=1181884 RepID=A0A562IMH3_9ACTN|nr:SDR family NAD(P)-dependent oxidoreductase [Modestobacter roseus]MQA33745.1 glucose 1-dehydrogenase [Modestobacter roseus]TWH72072.1 2-hydroxycyclohexanecarboxyl-CoA dehydrogenase [Modestobacter roseus]
MSLNGRVAVVTGGSRGIGRAIATTLAAQGAAVAVWDLNADGADETVAAIRAAGGTAIACSGDASDRATIAASAARTRQELGQVTILVNNAGISGFEPFLSITEESWNRMMTINLKGPFLCTQELLPDMLAAHWGRVINISSSSAQTGAPAMGHYAASKGGVIGFTKALAMEYAPAGITVNNVPPGFVDTPMLRESPVDVDDHATTTPMRRAGKPEDIAHAVAYLASDEAGYVTGQTISVNGGRYLV